MTRVGRSTQLLVVLGALLMAASSASVAHGKALAFESGAERATVVELFTSEGCSSCPPAERWIAALEQRPDLWRRVVPLNWHVSYWDDLGWPDRFAHPAYTDRQYRYVRELELGSAYTPGFVVDGSEWRGFFRRRELPVREGPRVGVLALEVEGDRARVRFESEKSGELDLQAHVAVLGFGLRSDVERGENRGRTLVQNFVVLGHARVPAVREGGRFTAELAVPEPDVGWPERAALVAWVSVDGRTAPLQATGGFLP